MNASLVADLVRRFALISLISVGGAGAVLPEVHRQLVGETGWLSAREFSDLFALAQAAPGPNVIAFSLFGWRLAGYAGLAAVTLATLAPAAAVALLVARFDRHPARARWAQRLRRSLAPLAIGFMLASGVLLAEGARLDGAGPLGIAATAGAAVFVIKSRRNPLYAVAASALAFVIAGRIGVIT